MTSRPSSKVGAGESLGPHSDVRCESPRHGWEPFDVRQVVSLLDTVPVRWWLSGGAALDQFLGFANGEHGDIDVSVVRSDWPLLQEALSPALDLWVAQRGTLYPIDERDVDAKVHSIWARESEKGLGAFSSIWRT